jgi:hypothetical protein
MSTSLAIAPSGARLAPTSTEGLRGGSAEPTAASAPLPYGAPPRDLADPAAPSGVAVTRPIATPARFTLAGVDGAVVHVPIGRHHLLQLGDVDASPEVAGRLLAAFLAHAVTVDRRVSAVGVSVAEAERHRRLAPAGIVVVPVGVALSVALADFTVSGPSQAALRDELARARRAGVRAHEARPTATRADAHAAGDGGCSGPNGRRGSRRFVATDAVGDLLGTATFTAVGGERPGWACAELRTARTSPAGTAAALLVLAAATFRHEGAAHLRLGAELGIDSHGRRPGLAVRAAALLAAHRWLASPTTLAGIAAAPATFPAHVAVPIHVVVPARARAGALAALLTAAHP